MYLEGFAQGSYYAITYYDEQGTPEREVTVMGLDEQEDRWHVYRKDAAQLADNTGDRVLVIPLFKN